MQFFHLLLIFLAIIGSCTLGKNVNLCPFCMDDTFRECDDSCIRIHLVFVEDNKNKSGGWYYDCGTAVIQNRPKSVRRMFPDVFRFRGDLQFLDYLEQRGPVSTVFEVKFYKYGENVEKTDKYYQRRYEEEVYRKRMEQELLQRANETELKKQEHLENNDCNEMDVKNATNLVECVSKKVKDNEDYLMGAVGVIVVFLFWHMFKCCFKKSNNYELPAQVVYKKGNNLGEGIVIIKKQSEQFTSDDCGLFDVEG